MGMLGGGVAGWWDARRWGCRAVGMPGGGDADGSGTTPWALLIYIINSFFFFYFRRQPHLLKWYVCIRIFRGASLVVQWIRLSLPLKGVQV